MIMGSPNGEIVLSNPNGAYYPGQIISGYVEFKIDITQHFSGILVQYVGEAVVQWIENENEEYSGREEYFNYVQPIFGSNGPSSIPPGTVSLPFQYQLPFAVPSSFEGTKGKVWYKIIVNADSRNGERETIEREFCVIAPMDLNQNEDAKKPIDMEFEHINNCCLCSSKPLFIKVHLPASGYCPGQILPIQVTVDNKSNIEVRKMVFTLTKKQGFKSQSPQSDYFDPETVLAQVKRGPTLAGAHGQFTVDLTVPHIIVPNLENCSIICEDYYLKVTVKMTGCNEDDSGETDIYLGLLPVLGREDYEHPLKEELPQNPIPQNPIEIHPQHPTSQVQNYMPPPVPHYPVSTVQVTTESVQFNGNVLNPSQNVPYYYPSALPQTNWPWNGSSNTQVAYSPVPSAPPM